ncbi:hypothetical protein PHLCEN_2v12398 [Hermanssonia centrifuga]|uniref:Uncharacterized protein n=1 Tax=Hermanssonia centrifuga TaxID=98765 RepID=A0A2R6NH70_9APHY|nr:hypothetical protein PHLCEN_2v12398 [Hermanssonia centrifuga]
MSNIPPENELDINPGAGICTESNDKTGKACRCREYQEDKNPPPGQPIVCRECRHGKSLHVGKKSAHSLRSVEAVLRDLGVPDIGSTPKALEVAKRETNSQLRSQPSTASGSQKLQGKPKASDRQTRGSIS